MYAAALHRIPTQILDSSHVFETRIPQKERKIIKKITKSWYKNTKIWNRFVPNRPTIFSLDCCRQRHFYLDQNYLVDQSSALYAQFHNNEFRRKRLNRFKRFIFVDSDNTFHIINRTTLKVALSSYQTILHYALQSEVWYCV